MTDKQKTRHENVDVQMKERSPAIAPLDAKAEKSKAEAKTAFYKKIQALRRANKMQ